MSLDPIGRLCVVRPNAIDDQTAIKVTDDGAEVVSEGRVRLFER